MSISLKTATYCFALLVLSIVRPVIASAAPLDESEKFLIDRMFQIYIEKLPSYKYVIDLDSEPVANVERSLDQILNSQQFKAITDSIAKANQMSKSNKYDKWMAASIHAKPSPGNRYYIASSLFYTRLGLLDHVFGRENKCAIQFSSDTKNLFPPDCEICNPSDNIIISSNYDKKEISNLSSDMPAPCKPSYLLTSVAVVIIDKAKRNHLENPMIPPVLFMAYKKPLHCEQTSLKEETFGMQPDKIKYEWTEVNAKLKCTYPDDILRIASSISKRKDIYLLSQNKDLAYDTKVTIGVKNSTIPKGKDVATVNVINSNWLGNYYPKPTMTPELIRQRQEWISGWFGAALDGAGVLGGAGGTSSSSSSGSASRKTDSAPKEAAGKSQGLDCDELYNRCLPHCGGKDPIAFIGDKTLCEEKCYGAKYKCENKLFSKAKITYCDAICMGNKPRCYEDCEKSWRGTMFQD